MARDLRSAVSQTIKQAESFLSTTEELHPRLKILTRSLETSAKKLLSSEAPLRKLRLIFGLASRFCLESLGYIDYYATRSTSHPTVDTRVVGVWTTDEAVGTHYMKRGVPVWLLRHSSLVPHSPDHNTKYVQPRGYCHRARLPEDCFRDDGPAAGHPVLFQERQNDTGALLGEIDSWVERKLEEWQQYAHPWFDL